MKTDDLLFIIQHSKGLRKTRTREKKKYNTGKLSEEEIMKQRKMLNDKNYMNEAVVKTAEIIMEVLK